MSSNNKFSILPVILITSALLLSICAAYYSISGLSKLFSGAITAVIAMATVLEVSKIVTTITLHKYWKILSKTLKSYLVISVLILMLITSLGIYGFLTAAFQKTFEQSKYEESKVELYKSKEELQSEQLRVYLHRDSILRLDMKGIRNAVSDNKQQYTDRRGNTVITSSSANRKIYQSELQNIAEELKETSNKIRICQDSIEVFKEKQLELRNNSKAGREIGPLKYISRNTGLPLEKTVNYLILLFVIVFDPLAIALIVTYTRIIGEKPKETLPSEVPHVQEVDIEPPQEVDLFQDSDTLVDSSILEGKPVKSLERYRDYYNKLITKYPERKKPYSQILELINDKIKNAK